MNINQKITALQKLVDSSKSIDEYNSDNPSFKSWKLQAERTLTKIFGENSIEINNFSELLFYKNLVSITMGRDYSPEHKKAFEKDLQTAIMSFENYIEEFKEETAFTTESENIQDETLSNEIFIVHGHDEEMKQSVARTLEKLDLKPIILHEQPNEGRTVIQKFSDHSDVSSFAVVLLSPDDMAYSKIDGSENIKTRARQNVILEMGYFLGKLRIKNVVALHKSEEDFELPSDYAGVIYIPYDKAGAWKALLVREMRACGYDVDANKVI